jgi:hypothetical protein
MAEKFVEKVAKSRFRKEREEEKKHFWDNKSVFLFDRERAW